MLKDRTVHYTSTFGVKPRRLDETVGRSPIWGGPEMEYTLIVPDKQMKYDLTELRIQDIISGIGCSDPQLTIKGKAL